MMYHLAIANLIYATLVVQPSMNSLLPDVAFRPWLPGIALAACLMFQADLSAVIWAFVLGLCVDCLSIHRLGVHTMTATSLVVCLRMTRGDDRQRGMLWFGFDTFVVTVVWLIISGSGHALLENQSLSLESQSVAAGLIAAVTTLLVTTVMIAGTILKFGLQSKAVSSITLVNHWTMLSGK